MESTLTGWFVSNGLFEVEFFAISRTARNTSCPNNRMQVFASWCDTFPSLPQTPRMPGRDDRLWRDGDDRQFLELLFERGSVAGFFDWPVANSTKARRLSGLL
jgi:hypothetical protein